MAAAAVIMRKMVKKIAGEIPDIRFSPFQIFYEYQDLFLSLLILDGDVNKNY